MKQYPHRNEAFCHQIWLLLLLRKQFGGTLFNNVSLSQSLSMLTLQSITLLFKDFIIQYFLQETICFFERSSPYQKTLVTVFIRCQYFPFSLFFIPALKKRPANVWRILIFNVFIILHAFEEQLQNKLKTKRWSFGVNRQTAGEYGQYKHVNGIKENKSLKPEDVQHLSK